MNNKLNSAILRLESEYQKFTNAVTSIPNRNAMHHDSAILKIIEEIKQIANTPKTRRFVHKDGFGDDTRFVEIDEKGHVYLIDKNNVRTFDSDNSKWVEMAIAAGYYLEVK